MEECSRSAPVREGDVCRPPAWPWHVHDCTRQGPQSPA